MGLARLRAAVMQSEVFQLAVWDGRPANGVAGTAADCVEWERQGGTTRIVTIPKDRPALDAVIFTKPGDRPRWALRSMLFADFAGFSRLEEDRLSQFLEVVMGRIAAVLDRHGDAVLTRNSWGDAAHAVIATPAQAAEIALEIQSELNPKLLQEMGLPAEGGMRISLHHGPIFEHFDAVRSRPDLLWHRSHRCGADRTESAGRRDLYHATLCSDDRIRPERPQFRIGRQDGPGQELWGANLVPAGKAASSQSRFGAGGSFLTG